MKMTEQRLRNSQVSHTTSTELKQLEEPKNSKLTQDIAHRLCDK